MAANQRQSFGGLRARHDIAVALLVCGAGCAPGPTSLRVTFSGQPLSEQGDLRFKVFATQDERSCAELEAMVVPQPPIPDVEVIALREVPGNEWPRAIDLVPIRQGGRAFGVVLLSNVPHATFCSEPGLSEVEAQVHLLRTRPGPTMHAQRARFSAVPLGGGAVVVVGGSRAGQAVEVFDPQLDAFTLISPLILERRFGVASALPDGRVLVSGGLAPSRTAATARVEVVDPDGGPSTLVESMETARELHAATLLPNGSVLVTGGLSGSFALSSAELYEPDAGTWRAVGELGAARFFHTATLLADGTVLIAGGADLAGSLSSTELYDPATQTFSPGPAMDSPRDRHVAVLLADGSVLLAGGGGLNAERFVPATRTLVPAGALSVEDDNPCATRLPSGQVALSGTSQVVQVFEPLTSGWSATAVLSVARQGCQAWLAPAGGVLFAGGNANAHHASTEIVEP